MGTPFTCLAEYYGCERCTPILDRVGGCNRSCEPARGKPQPAGDPASAVNQDPVSAPDLERFLEHLRGCERAVFTAINTSSLAIGSGTSSSSTCTRPPIVLIPAPRMSSPRGCRRFQSVNPQAEASATGSPKRNFVVAHLLCKARCPSVTRSD
jgi:hypothetical protein